jgi:hypothetical protein
MFYLVALIKYQDKSDNPGFKNFYLGGVRYNVIRRPLSGGRGSIRKHQPTKSNPNGESDDQFYDRLSDVIRDDADYYFMRWTAEVTSQDLDRFEHDFLIPCLEELCNWWDWINSPAGQKDPFSDAIHYRTPFGLYNVLAEGGATELDEYLATGSDLGLQRATELFGELK